MLALFVVLVLALTPVIGEAATPSAAATPPAAATPAAGTPAVNACLGNDALCAKPGTAEARALAEQLAQKYAPVMYLKMQTGPCDDKGEPVSAVAGRHRPQRSPGCAP